MVMMVMVMMVILMMMMMRTQLQAYQNITVFSTAAFCMWSAIFTHATTSAMMLMMLLLLSAWIGATVQQTGVLDSLSAKV